jgi:hypothetical protein
VNTFFDKKPGSWKDLEQMVQQAFCEMGYESKKSHSLDTVRGKVEIDVFARKTTTPIPTIVLCECKYWNKPVSQHVIHGFRTVCADVGAHFGLIISKVGFQAGAETSRSSTNVHLMNFKEFQETFFEEWRSGACTMLVKMHDQLLPILRASMRIQENGLDTIPSHSIDGVDAFRKYAILLGYEGRYSEYFIMPGEFPATISDPRGDPRVIQSVTVKSHREYLEVAREATLEATRRFNLPETYFSTKGTPWDA